MNEIFAYYMLLMIFFSSRPGTPDPCPQVRPGRVSAEGEIKPAQVPEAEPQAEGEVSAS